MNTVNTEDTTNTTSTVNTEDTTNTANTDDTTLLLYTVSIIMIHNDIHEL